MSSEIRKYLKEQKLETSLFPILLDISSEIGNLSMIGLAPNWEMIEHGFEELRQTSNYDVMRKLLEVGEGYHLFFQVVQYLFWEELDVSWDLEAIDILKKLVIPLKDKMDQLNRDAFVLSLIGMPAQGADFISEYGALRRFLEKVEIDQEPEIEDKEDKDFPPQYDLRSYVTLEFLDDDIENELENWLLDYLEVGELTRTEIEEARERWLLDLENVKELTSQEPDNLEYNTQCVQSLYETNPLKAIYYLKKLPLENQVSYAEKIVESLFKIEENDEARRFVIKLQEEILDSVTESEKIDLCKKLLIPLILVADAGRVILTFKEIDDRGFTRLCTSLGVDAEEFCNILFMAFLENKILVSLQLSPFSIDQLMWNMRKSPSKRERNPFYEILLATRIFQLGEDGISYPPKEKYEKYQDLCYYLAEKYGANGDLPLFLNWLSKTVDVLGPSYVETVYKSIKAQYEAQLRAEQAKKDGEDRDDEDDNYNYLKDQGW